MSDLSTPRTRLWRARHPRPARLCPDCLTRSLKPQSQFCAACAASRKAASQAAWKKRNLEALRLYWHNRHRYGVNTYRDLDAEMKAALYA